MRGSHDRLAHANHRRPERLPRQAVHQGNQGLVSVILAELAAGESYESIIAGYHVEQADIQAALAYAADVAHDRVISWPEAG